jgi:hypothetical protein
LYRLLYIDEYFQPLEFENLILWEEAVQFSSEILIFVAVRWYVELQKKSRSIKNVSACIFCQMVGVFSSRDMHLTVIRLHDVTVRVSRMGCYGVVAVEMVK